MYLACRYFRCLLVASLLSTTTISPLILAAPADSPKTGAPRDEKKNAKNKQAASQLLAEGNDLSGDGQYLEALEKFNAAYALFPSPKLLLNIGTMQRQLGRNVEAGATYEAYLRDPEADPKQAASLARTLDEIDALVGHMHVQVTPKDAVVSLDGVKLDVPSGETIVRVEPGTHKIVGEKQGLPPTVQTFSLKRGEKADIVLKLSPTPVVVKSVVVKQRQSPLRTAGFVVGGVGLVGLAVGAGAGIGALVQNKRALAGCDSVTARCSVDGIGTANSALTAASISTISLSVGGAATVTGLVLFLLSRSSRDDVPRKTASISFEPRPSGGFLSVGGTF